MPNPFVYAELATTDVPRAREFYSKLFRWKLQATPMPVPGGEEYTFIDVVEGTGGGMLRQKIPGASSAWLPYVLVGDIDAATKKARKLGAKICKDVTEVPDMGWLSIIVDPTGATLGLWETKRRRTKRS
jgi:predicted enzyme related to lactoylglutathione lyase